MITMQITVDLKDDRQVVLTLPPQVPTGQTELVVTIAPKKRDQPKRPGTSLAEWADTHAEDWGDQISSEDVEGFTGRRY
jgi:hypothetical protein